MFNATSGPKSLLFPGAQDDATASFAPRTTSRLERERATDSPGRAPFGLRNKPNSNPSFRALDLASSFDSRHSMETGEPRPSFDVAFGSVPSPVRRDGFIDTLQARSRQIYSEKKEHRVFPAILAGHPSSWHPSERVERQEEYFEAVSRRTLQRGPYSGHEVLFQRDGTFAILSKQFCRGRDTEIHVGIVGSLNEPGSTYLAAIKKVENPVESLSARIGREEAPLPLSSSPRSDARRRRQDLWSERLFGRQAGMPLVPWQVLSEFSVGHESFSYFAMSDLAFNDLGEALRQRRVQIEGRSYAGHDRFSPASHARFLARSRLFSSAFYRLAELVRLLDDLHENAGGSGGGISHNDLKLSNIFVDDRFGLSLADLEFATPINHHGQPVVGGSPQFLPPEVWIGSSAGRHPTIPVHQGFSSDMWSLAFVLPHLLLPELPAKESLEPLHMRPYIKIFEHNFSRLTRMRQLLDSLVKTVREMTPMPCFPKRWDFERRWDMASRIGHPPLSEEAKRSVEEKLGGVSLVQELNDNITRATRDLVAWLNENDGNTSAAEYVGKLGLFKQQLDYALPALEQLQQTRERLDGETAAVWAQELRKRWSEYRSKLFSWQKQEHERVWQPLPAPAREHPLPRLSRHDDDHFISLRVFERFAALDQEFGWGPRLSRLMTGLLHPDTGFGRRLSAHDLKTELFSIRADLLLGRLPPAAMGQQATTPPSATGVEQHQFLAGWKTEHARLTAWTDDQNSRLRTSKRRVVLSPRDLFTPHPEEHLRKVGTALGRLALFDSMVGGNFLFFRRELRALSPTLEEGPQTLYARLMAIDSGRDHPLCLEDSRSLAKELLGEPGALYSIAKTWSKKGIPNPHETLRFDFFSRPSSPLRHQADDSSWESLVASTSTLRPMPIKRKAGKKFEDSPLIDSASPSVSPKTDLHHFDPSRPESHTSSQSQDSEDMDQDAVRDDPFSADATHSVFSLSTSPSNEGSLSQRQAEKRREGEGWSRWSRLVGSQQASSVSPPFPR